MTRRWVLIAALISFSCLAISAAQERRRSGSQRSGGQHGGGQHGGQSAKEKTPRQKQRDAHLAERRKRMKEKYEQFKGNRAPVRDQRRIFRKHVKSWLEIRNQKIVMQQRDYSCGAAALATMMRFHWGDKRVNETRLLIEVVRMLNVDEMRDRIRNGLSLTDLRRLAVRVGYLSTIGPLTFDKLRESKIPLIVGIIVDEFDHFVVVRGTDDFYVYLADPSRGNIRVPIPKFIEQWQKNLALVVFKPGGDPKMQSPIGVRPEEIFHGETNRIFLRDQTSRPMGPPPR